MEWAELNPDLLHLIVKILCNISNFIRFRVVCKKWRFAAPTSDPPPTLPWFLESNPITENKCCYRFYSLYSNKTQNLNIPQAQDTRICFGSSCKYVQCMDDLESNISYPFMFLKLFDPLTGSKIPMPFTGPKKPIPLKDDSIVLRRQYIGPNHSYNPNSSFDGAGGAVAMMVGWHMMGYNSLIALFRLDGENETTSMNKHILQKKIVIYETSMFVTKILDVPTRDVVSPEQRLRLTYLLEACGDVLGVVQNFKTSELDILLDKILFELYKLEDVGTKTPRWVKVHDGIGDRMLFPEPRFRTSFCLNARYFDGFKGNCIYFKECNGTYSTDSITSLAQFNIEDGTTQLLPLKFHGVWFVPHP